METAYMVGAIRFQFAFNLSGEEDIFYNAELREEEDEFRIYILLDGKITLEDLSFKSARWNDEISYNTWGKTLKTKGGSINDQHITLNLSSAQLLTMRSKVYRKIREYYFVINSYEYSYLNESKLRSCIFHLSLPDNQLVRDLKLIEYDYERDKYISNPYTLEAVNVKCKIQETNIAPYSVIIEYGNCLAEIETKNNLLLDLISFYYAIPIEAYKRIEYNKGTVTINHKQPSCKPNRNFQRNYDLDYLIFNEGKYDLINFLKSIRLDIEEEKLEPIHVTINDYIKASSLDEVYRFLILYSALETLTKRMFKAGKYDESEKTKSLISTLNKIFKTEISSIDNSAEKKILTENWKYMKRQLHVKYIKHPIMKFCKSLNLDWDKINAEFTNKTFETNNIIKLRDQLIHNRNFILPCDVSMANINANLSFIVCIAILKEFGIEVEGFDIDFPLLNLFYN